MKKATNRELLHPAEIGKDMIRVSHLQFADDTIFMGTTTEENARVIKRIMRNLELMLGLKVNYEKCSIFGMNLDDRKLIAMVAILTCKVEKILFSYLGIKV